MEELCLKGHDSHEGYMGIKEGMAQDRSAWRNIFGGPTHASAEA